MQIPAAEKRRRLQGRQRLDPLAALQKRRCALDQKFRKLVQGSHATSGEETAITPQAPPRHVQTGQAVSEHSRIAQWIYGLGPSLA